jgi:RND family efflux transporter MFP subunit
MRIPVKFVIRPSTVAAWLSGLSGLLLVACGGGLQAPPPVAAPTLQTISAAAGGEGESVAWDGVVQAVEQSVLSAQTSGRVTALGADVDTRVAAGAALLRLTSEEQSAAVDRAEAQLRAAEAQVADAAARYRRAINLVDQEVIARDEFDRVKAASESAAAARDVAAAQLAQTRQQLGYTVVRAPYAGVVSARQVEQGETVAPGQPLFTLYAPGRLRVEVLVPQRDADAIRAQPQATLTLADGRQVSGAGVTVFPSADPAAHSNAVRVQLPAVAAPPRPGQAVKVRFAAARAPAGIWLPESAVTVRGELTGVYVVRQTGVLLRQVRTGRREGGRVEILAGVAAGEAVATDPLAALQALRQRQAAGAAQ